MTHLMHHLFAETRNGLTETRSQHLARQKNPRPGPEPLLRKIGETYASSPDVSTDARVTSLYRQYSLETARLFDLIKIPVEFVDWDPYQDPTGWPDADLMRDQVVAEKRMLITQLGNVHPLLNADQNLRGRAVHDLLAHLVCGYPFTGAGELNAFEAQASLYSVNLRPVLFGEIVGQAGYFLTYGKFMEPQKTVLYPVEVEATVQGLRQQFPKGLGLAGVVDLGLVSDKIFDVVERTGYSAAYSYAVLEQQTKAGVERALNRGGMV